MWIEDQQKVEFAGYVQHYSREQELGEKELVLLIDFSL